MTPLPAGATGEGLRLAQGRGRWTLAVTVLASAIVFLDGSVVNVALHSIRVDLGAGLSGVQWVVDGYLLTLGSLLVLGGSLGDLYGRRRVVIIGIAGFALASLACGAAPNIGTLIVARALQGIAGALLVPGSLAIIAASFHPDDRGRAIGAWSGATSAVFVIGPLLGGWLIGFSWRWIFLINVPLAAITVALALAHVPESRDDRAARRPDLLGATMISLGLAGVVYALIEGPAKGWSGTSIGAAIVGVLALMAFPLIERAVANPMVPLSIFQSRRFSGGNLVTFTVYAALGVSGFLGVTFLQDELGYSPLAAGLAFLPSTVLVIGLSAPMGALTTRIGPRLPMTVGPLLIATGLALMARIADGSSYVTVVLPAALVFGLGLGITVAPLTTAVLSGIAPRQSGIGAAINNAVARIASLLGVAVLPALSGLASSQGPHHADYIRGYQGSLLGCALLALVGAATAALTIRNSVPSAPRDP